MTIIQADPNDPIFGPLTRANKMLSGVHNNVCLRFQLAVCGQSLTLLMYHVCGPARNLVPHLYEHMAYNV